MARNPAEHVAPVAGADADEAVDAAAQGFAPTSDDADQLEDAGDGEIDAMGKAAGLTDPRGKPLDLEANLDRKDKHRWENDPASADDAKERDA